MKSVLNVYKNVGSKVQASMARGIPVDLTGASPVIHQTPGRLQYYRIENEPFLPGKLDSIQPV